MTVTSSGGSIHSGSSGSSAPPSRAAARAPDPRTRALSMRSARENSIISVGSTRHRLRCGSAPCPRRHRNWKSRDRRARPRWCRRCARTSPAARNARSTMPATQRAPEVVNSSHATKPRPATAAARASHRPSSNTFLQRRRLHRSGPSSTCSRQRCLQSADRSAPGTRHRRGSAPAASASARPRPRRRSR